MMSFCVEAKFDDETAKEAMMAKLNPISTKAPSGG